MLSKIDQFRAELKKLLLKYDASIDWSCDSDMQGVYGERMIISVDQWPKDTTEEVVCYQGSISGGDL